MNQNCCIEENHCIKEDCLDWKQRLIKEHDELEDKTHKLNIALHKDDFKDKVGEKQFNLLKEQAKYMTNYLLILEDRMRDLDIKVR